MIYWLFLFQIGFFMIRDYALMMGIYIMVTASICLSKRKLALRWKENRLSLIDQLSKLGIAFFIAMLLFYSYTPKDLIHYIKGDEIHGYCVYLDNSGFDFYAYHDGKYRKFKVFKRGLDESFENTYLCISGFGKNTLLPANRGGFDYDSYLKAHHYEGYFYPKIIEKSTKTPEMEDPWVKFKLSMSKFRRELIHRLVLLSDDSQVLLRALLFAQMEGDWLAQYSKKLGIIHIFVISGFHLSLLAGGFKKICRFVLKNYHVEEFLYLVFCFLFLNLNPFAIGSMRAYLMCVIAVICFYTKRKYDSTRVLILVAGIWGFVNPNVLIQSGFSLSFGGSLCLLEFSRHKKIQRIDAEFLRNFIISAMICLAMFPVIYVYYLEIHFIQILLLPFITPLIAIYMVLGVLFFEISFLHGAGGEIMIGSTILEFVTNGMNFFANLIRKFMEANLFLEGEKLDIPYVLAIFFAILILLYLLLHNYRNDIIHRSELFLLCFIIALYFSFSNQDFGFSMRTFALRDGESYLIRWNNTNLVYDVSNDREIINCLKRCGVSKIDLLVISHFDEDHCGKLDAILQNFEVKSTIYNASKPKKIHLNGADIKYGAWESEKRNEASIVMFIEYEGKSMLLNGDIEDEGLEFQNREFVEELKKADIVKIPHHGSYREGFGEMFELSCAKCYIIGGGRGKRIRKIDTLKNLQLQNLPYYDTNVSGEILINYRFGDWKIVEYRNEL